MCVIVPIKADSARNLQNGGLVKLIMHQVKEDECVPNQDKQLGFIKAPTPCTNKTVHSPQETGKVSAPDLEEKCMLSIVVDSV
jgi:hypothetical protein